MALTREDKRWLRKMHREEIMALLTDMAAAQIGGYEGATEVPDDDEGAKQKKRKVGFQAPTERQTMLRKLL